MNETEPPQGSAAPSGERTRWEERHAAATRDPEPSPFVVAHAERIIGASRRVAAPRGAATTPAGVSTHARASIPAHASTHARASIPAHASTHASTSFPATASTRDASLRALDVAAGGGRHARLLRALGFSVVALDFARQALWRIRETSSGVKLVCADARALPLRPSSFDLIVQTAFLERAALPDLAALLVPGGTLVVETFLVDQFERTGHPRREFCLERGEIVRLCAAPGIGLTIDDARETPEGAQAAAMLASVAARKS